MASQREDFSVSGPLHLTAIDWSYEHHRRSVAACLVEGIYIVERDRQRKRQASQALAPPWWEFFQFRLIRKLVDDVDGCVFGGIYEYNPQPSSHCIKSLDQSPGYVIAFRGTLKEPDSILRDIELDIRIVRNGLHTTTRFQIALQAVRDIVASVGGSRVWLAGHSLGAAMALLAGKTMGKTGTFIESFVFNPPFLSLPIEKIKDKRIQSGIRIAGSVLTAGLALAANAIQPQHHLTSLLSGHDPFDDLAGWLPRLYVNQRDYLCCEYIGYFEHRKKMEEIFGAFNIERLATQHSLGGLLMNAIAKGVVVADEPFHLLPSASVTVNLIPANNFKEAHRIHQWWRHDLKLDFKVYKYK